MPAVDGAADEVRRWCVHAQNERPAFAVINEDDLISLMALDPDAGRMFRSVLGRQVRRTETKVEIIIAAMRGDSSDARPAVWLSQWSVRLPLMRFLKKRPRMIELIWRSLMEQLSDGQWTADEVAGFVRRCAAVGVNIWEDEDDTGI